MTMPTWEIVIIVLIILTIAAAATYFFIRCFKSIRAVKKEADKNAQNPNPRPKPRSHWTAACSRPGFDVAEVYGVPYQSEFQPQPLDPARLEAAIMRSSDLHPCYLEKKQDFGDVNADSPNLNRDSHVSWRGDSILLDNEFLPSMSEPPMVEIYSDSSSIVALTDSPRPRKKVYINYDCGVDGAPEIKQITTDVVIESPHSESSSEIDPDDLVFDEVTQHEFNDPSEQPANIDSPKQRHLVSVPKETWVEFEKELNTRECVCSESSA